MKFKKRLSWSLLATSLMAGTILGSASAQTNSESVQVKVNGIEIHDTYKTNGTSYASLEEYSKLTNASLSLNENQAAVNGKQVEVTYHNDIAMAKVRDLAEATKAHQVNWNAEKQEVYVLQLPEGTVQITPIIPAMGEHWANPAELPEGPIYGVYNGELTFLEYMIPKETFDKGENVVELGGMKGLASLPIQHTDIEIQPNGHEGMEIPHYDIHHYFVTHGEHMAIKPEGPAPAQHDHHAEKPAISGEVTVSGTTAVVNYEVTGLKVSAENYGKQHVEGEGHAHVYLDGQKVNGVKEQAGSYEIKDLTPGKHSIYLDVRTNDHQDLGVRTADFEIEVK